MNHEKLIIEGNEMAPLLKIGDEIYINASKTFSKVRVGDVVCIKRKDKMYACRISYTNRKKTIATADNYGLDTEVKPHEYIGTIVRYKRKNDFFDIDTIYFLQQSLYMSEFLLLKKDLDSNGIDILLLKGSPINYYFGENIQKRLYRDCDILIKKNNTKKIISIFKKHGYHMEDSHNSSSIKSSKYTYGEFNMVKSVKNFKIVFDLHTEIVFLPNFSNLHLLYPKKNISRLTEIFWKEKKTINISEKKVYILSPENMFIYLLLHLFNHNYIGSFRYYFLLPLIKKNLDYKSIYGLLHEFRLNNYVFPAYYYLVKKYNVSPNKYFISKIKPEGVALNFIRKLKRKLGRRKDELKINEDLIRYSYLFYLSPSPFWKRFAFLVMSHGRNYIFKIFSLGI